MADDHSQSERDEHDGIGEETRQDRDIAQHVVMDAVLAEHEARIVLSFEPKPAHEPGQNAIDRESEQERSDDSHPAIGDQPKERRAAQGAPVVQRASIQFPAARSAGT